MEYEVTLTLSFSISAGGEGGNEDLAQERAELVAAAALKGIATIKNKWLISEVETELEVVEEG